MSYVSKRTRGRVRRRHVLGGLLDDLERAANELNLGPDNSAALDDAKCDPVAASQMTLLTGQIDDVINNWNPPGNYTADQLGQAINFMMQMTDPVVAGINKALNELQLPSQRDRLQAAVDNVQKSIGIGGFGVDPLGPYSAMVATVKQSGDADNTIIQATGFKRTVVDILKAIRLGTFELKVVECARPGTMLGLLATVGSVVDSFVQFVKDIGNAIVTVAKTVAKIPDAIGTFFTYAKWAALLGGVYFIAVKAGVVPPAYDPLRLRD